MQQISFPNIRPERSENERWKPGFIPVGYFLGTALDKCAGATKASVKVRRSSHRRGSYEGQFWQPTTKRDCRQILLAAKRFDRLGRRKGERNGPLGHVALEVLELFGNLVGFKTGQLDPSLKTMMRLLGRSKDAVVRALKALRRFGFLEWIRRYEPTGNETGPQIRQFSNAYRMALPERARRQLGTYGQRPPIPNDAATYEEAKAEAFRQMLDDAGAVEKVRVMVEDGPLADALARLGRSIEERREREESKGTERESAERSESPQSFYSHKGGAE